MTRIVDLADGSSSATAPTTTPVPTTGASVSLDNTGTDWAAEDAQEFFEEADDRIGALEDANFDNFLGYWNANTNSPAVSSGGAGITEGQYYVVSVAGTTLVDGISDWGVGDEVFYDGTVWKKRDNSDLVLSVAGRTGTVTLDAADVAETATRFWAKKINASASAPTATDDSASGYSVGSRWLNTTTSRLYVATSVGVGVAAWALIEGAVLSVNSATGVVVLDAGDIAEADGRFWSLKNNLSAVAAPVVGDDSVDGYAAGSMWYNQATNTLYVCESASVGAAVWTAVSGSGGGGLDTFHSEGFTVTVAADFSTGNNATFLGGGSFAGAMADETAAPLSGTTSMKYTQAAGSLNDYLAAPVVSIPLGARGTHVGIRFPYLYNGSTNDLKVVIYDVTNSQVLTSTLDLLEAASSVKFFQASVFIPASCTQVRYGIQVVALNSAKILYFDNVELSTNPFIYKNMVDVQSLAYSNQQQNFADLSGEARFPTSGSTLTTANFSGPVVLRVEDDAASTRTKFVATRKCSGTIFFSGNSNATGGQRLQVFKNGVLIQSGSEAVSGGAYAFVSASFSLEAGDYLTVGASTGLENSTRVAYLNIVAHAANEAVVTSNQSFSTDTTPLVYASSSQYTEATLPNAPIGTFITFTHAASSHTETQTTTAPTQTTANMALQGIALATRNFTQATTSGAPSYFAIQVGKGLKACQVLGFNGTTKSTTCCLDFSRDGTTELGMLVKEYSPVTGILKLNLGRRQTGTNTDHFVFDSGANGANPVYIVANASPNPVLAAAPTLQVAYLKDIKTAGSSGGNFASGAWRTRTLNTVEGDSAIVTLSSNQFTLGPGEYDIDASAPGYACIDHQAKLRNITAGTDQIAGTGERSEASDSTSTISRVVGRLSLTSTTTFELQHQCAATNANGFGDANTFGISVVFAIVKITKLR
jgi:hypothetical protein